MSWLESVTVEVDLHVPRDENAGRVIEELVEVSKTDMVKVVIENLDGEIFAIQGRITSFDIVYGGGS